MIRTLSLISLLLLVLPACSNLWAANRFTQGWQKLQDIEPPQVVESETGSQSPIPLLAIEEPPIKGASHLIAGEIQFSDVTLPGIVEMWTVYTNGQRYFTRTMAEFGPMAKMIGTSDWRPLMLSFQGEAGRPPIKLEVNVILPGGGKVEFRNLALYQSPGNKPRAWWTDKQAGLYGGISGAVLGLLGALCGCLAGFGKARRFVLGLLLALLILGVISLALGIYAITTSQPRSVWSPLLIVGLVMTVSMSVVLVTTRNAYLQRELRKISAAA